MYNVPFALRLTGPLDVAALHEAVNAVVARHAALRTVFVVADGEVRQVVRPRLRIELPVTDLSTGADPSREEAVERAAAAHAAYPFALDTGPLLAARLLTLGAEDHLLLVTVHHIVFDAWSADVFTADLVAYYGRVRRRGTGPAAGAGGPVPEYAGTERPSRRRWPRPTPSSPTGGACWTPRPRCRPCRRTARARRCRPTAAGGGPCCCQAELTDRLADLARGSGVTLNAVVLAGIATLLRQATGQDDLLLGMPAAGRSHDHSGAPGRLFANMLVLRADLTGPPTVRELVAADPPDDQRRVRATRTRPTRGSSRRLAPPRDSSMNPLLPGHGDDGQARRSSTGRRPG